MKTIRIRTGAGWLGHLALVVCVFIGIAFRFTHLNWSEGTNLHPDEYGLTNTLTQLRLPASLAGYFNTRLSPLSPYPQYDPAGRFLQDGPDNRLRWGQWPMILIRAAAEATGNTGYDELRLMGRWLSALADSLALWLLYLIGRRLYNPTTGLLATALTALAVLAIQQSHFMTVDNFATLFTLLTLYAGVRVAKNTHLLRSPEEPRAGYRLAPHGWRDYALFGVAFGMAIASRINLLPLGGLILPAAFIDVADLRLSTPKDFRRILLLTGLCLAITAATALLAFRLAQPMSFRRPTGDTTLFTFHLNPDWTASMQLAQAESSGIGGGPPAEQWSHRPALLFPMLNIAWGMGPLLCLTAWAGFGWATGRVLRSGQEWQSHLLPLVWVGGYFLFMGTRWAKSLRYFLQIYPCLSLLAAWALLELWQKRPKGSSDSEQNHIIRQVTHRLRALLPAGLTGLVLLGTLAWAVSFVQAVYLTDHTRLQASRWIIQNVPAPFHLILSTAQGDQAAPIAAPDPLTLAPGQPYVQAFSPAASGTLRRVTLPHALALSEGVAAGRLTIRIAHDPQGTQRLDEAAITAIPSRSEDALGPSAQAEFHGAALSAGETYYLVAAVDQGAVQVSRTVISNETWDEGLPLRMDGYDPFGQFYTGVEMQARWADDEAKRRMFAQTLDAADFLILPSQRAIWASCRLPLTYPMTMAYYRALFDGSLGFDRVARFTAPLRLGPLVISDLAGSAAWGHEPDLPLFNYNPLAAEEAFSVYDHPPVWVFKKRPDYDPAKVRALLDSVDLSQVVVQTPKDATLIVH